MRAAFRASPYVRVWPIPDLDKAALVETADAYWGRYLETLPAGHPHRGARLDAFAFGDSPELANELAALVVSGRKRATTSLPVEFTASGVPLPAVGDVSIVKDGAGRSVAIIELTEVRHTPFGRVDEAFAATEGEGDGTLMISSARGAFRKARTVSRAPS